MLRGFLTTVFLLTAYGADAPYDLSVRIEPQAKASVSLFGVTTSFETAALSDASGQVLFRNVAAGSYTLAVFVPGRGEARRTIDVGPGTADSRRRVALTLELGDSEFESKDTFRALDSVPASQLAIPEAATREYEAAGADLRKPDAESAERHLERAVAIAPQFSAAWNLLGTIEYHSREFLYAEECFRKALAADPRAYEPLVNLGGVLIDLKKIDEAMDYNLHAVLVRPDDALANSQLGLTYFAVGRYDLAQKYLERALRIDPAHFSYPQLTLAEIHLRGGNRRAAADDLEDLLKYHPDYPEAAKVREEISKLRK
jgi:tetratricopeptide (TPR) repeat protein